ncbi:MAG: GH3 auxin-responsive promoter family protein, partial [Candidatus Thorarchaeota archaeon]
MVLDAAANDVMIASGERQSWMTVFRPQSEQTRSIVLAILSHLVSVAAKRKATELQHILSRPIEHGEMKLNEIIRRNEATVFGRRHGFSDIRNPDEYSSRVPLSDAQSMVEYLNAVYENPTGGILTSEPVVWYLLSSGTTGHPKRLPITRQGMKDTKTGSMLGWMAFMNAEKGNEKIVDGTMVTFGAPAVMSHINGVPVGYASGVYGKHQNSLFKRLIRPGPEIFNMTDTDAKMWEYAKLVASSRTTAIQGIASQCLALIRRMLKMYGPALLQHFAGTRHEDRIRDAMNDDGTLDMAILCPELRMMGSSGIDIEPYRSWLKSVLPDMCIWEFYGISEAGIVGVQTEYEPGIKLLPHLNYLEFIPERDMDSPDPRVVPLSDVKKGDRYEVVVTSTNG